VCLSFFFVCSLCFVSLPTQVSFRSPYHFFRCASSSSQPLFSSVSWLFLIAPQPPRYPLPSWAMSPLGPIRFPSLRPAYAPLCFFPISISPPPNSPGSPCRGEGFQRFPTCGRVVHPPTRETFPPPRLETLDAFSDWLTTSSTFLRLSLPSLHSFSWSGALSFPPKDALRGTSRRINIETRSSPSFSVMSRELRRF